MSLEQPEKTQGRSKVIITIFECGRKEEKKKGSSRGREGGREGGKKGGK